MAKRILVPLDQTTSSESVVPLLATMARESGATVRLLNVAPPPHNVEDVGGRVIAYADQEMNRVEAERTEYLAGVKSGLERVAAECAVRFGEPVEEILAEADRFGADLIVMTTTCRSGVSRVALGSVAEQVLRKAKVAVVLFRPGLGTGLTGEGVADMKHPVAATKVSGDTSATTTTMEIRGRLVELEVGTAKGVGWVAVGIVTRGLSHEKGLTFKALAPTPAEAESRVRAEIETYFT
jgi:nucleotide-binding universal stress UspA family protein